MAAAIPTSVFDCSIAKPYEQISSRHIWSLMDKVLNFSYCLLFGIAANPL
jgi:hypothetical protein